MHKRQRPLTPLGKLRKARTLSQAQLAAILGVTQPTLCKYERGTLIPPPEMQALIATVLAGSVENLFPQSDPKEQVVP